jgi:integrase
VAGSSRAYSALIDTTIERYRAATNHLLRFIADVRPVRRVSDFRACHAEEFVRYLRSIKIAPNGHANAAKRHLRDKSVKFILETCSTLMNYAQRQRHLSPYAENPFRTIEIGRVPIEDAKPIVIFTPEQEKQFLEACDDWQFPIFFVLLFTGLRLGELTHLLLPHDVDLSAGWLHIRNKPALGWRIKTRNERTIPLHPIVAAVIKQSLATVCRRLRTTADSFKHSSAGTRITSTDCLSAANLRRRG